jgi:ribonuclease P protein component
VIARLTQRREFLDVQKGRRINTGLFVVQHLTQPERRFSRVGFTVSKRVSPSSVIRNRIRRRLKEAVRLEEHRFCATPTDYVLVARLAALTAPFPALRAELNKVLSKIAQSASALS